MKQKVTRNMETNEGILMISQILDQEPLIESYKFDGENVEIVINQDMMLMNMLTNKNYLLTKELVDNNLDWCNLDQDAKKMLLIVLNIATTEEDMFGEVTIPQEELQFEMELLNSYELETPELFNGYYIYYYKDFEKIKNIFVRNVEELINLVSISIPGTSIPEMYENIIVGVQLCGFHITIKKLAEICNISETDVIETLWDMAKKGFLRILT